jgi:hypothetical protein
MNHRAKPTQHQPRSAPTILLLAALALGIANCGSDEKTGGTSSCSTSADCTGANAGKLCVSGNCADCASDADCAADATYSASQTECQGGVCAEPACVNGQMACPCDAGACTQGECVGDVCTDCDRGDIDCICRANGTCSTGNVCNTDSLCEACTDGIEFCACRTTGEACDTDLICDTEICVTDPCTDGAQDCPCDSGGCSTTDLYCDSLDVCRLCTSDVEGCACDPGDVCTGDLYCDTSDTTCVTCPVTDKPLTCGCMNDVDCVAPNACDATSSVCRGPVTCSTAACVPNQVCDVSGRDASCVAESCDPGYVWNPSTSACDAFVPETCVDGTGAPTLEAIACGVDKGCAVGPDGYVVCVDTCTLLDCLVDNRECMPASELYEDATCSWCAPGFVEDAGICEINGLAACAGSEPPSIAGQCAVRNRICEPGSGSGAYCGDCLSGHAYDPDQNKCVEIPRCGDQICSSDEFCDFPQTGGPPSCVSRCDPGQVLDASSACVTCSITCSSSNLHGRQIDGQCVCEDDVYCAYHTDGSSQRCQTNPCPNGEATLDGTTCTACGIACGDDAGERPRLWPFRDSSANCFCETQSGYYTPYGGTATPRQCDADNDGWINETANLSWEAADGVDDIGILGNFRCDRRIIDRVVLMNDMGQRREVGICQGQMYDWAPGPGNMPAECSADPEKVVLFETDALEDDTSIATNNVSFPIYGSRKLRAAELNRMTKACVSTSADFNLNQVEDLQETQPLLKTELAGGATDADWLFRATSFFVELHRGVYQPPTVAGEPGAFVVQERSRCDDFPATYAAGPDGYWEGCQRRRDASWNEASLNNRTGLDFAQFDCAATSGSCALQAPVFTSLPSRDGDLVVDHDVCAMETQLELPIANEPWRGMNQSSQFRCMQISSTTDPYKAPRIQLSGGGGTDPTYDFNSCSAVTCSGTPGCVESTTQGSGEAQPDDPAISCQYQLGTSGNVPTDTVGLVAVRFLQKNGSYARGCINESLGTFSGATAAEVGRGWSHLCDGFDANPNGFLTAGSVGNFGKLICSCGLRYAGKNCEYVCPVNGTPYHERLHVGGSADFFYTAPEQSLYNCGPTGYCTQAAPDGSFPGGRRGSWMCGEITSTLAVDGDPVMTDPLQLGKYELSGAVRIVPFVRVPMKTDQTACDSGTPCYELF